VSVPNRFTRMRNTFFFSLNTLGLNFRSTNSKYPVPSKSTQNALNFVSTISVQVPTE
jgi:hypothetical protein